MFGGENGMDKLPEGILEEIIKLMDGKMMEGVPKLGEGGEEPDLSVTQVELGQGGDGESPAELSEAGFGGEDELSEEDLALLLGSDGDEDDAY